MSKEVESNVVLPSKKLSQKMCVAGSEKKLLKKWSNAETTRTGRVCVGGQQFVFTKSKHKTSKIILKHHVFV